MTEGWLLERMDERSRTVAMQEERYHAFLLDLAKLYLDMLRDGSWGLPDPTISNQPDVDRIDIEPSCNRTDAVTGDE